MSGAEPQEEFVNVEEKTQEEALRITAPYAGWLISKHPCVPEPSGFCRDGLPNGTHAGQQSGPV